MPRCALVVAFDLQPGAHEAFTALMRDHAARTLAEEPGCQQFDLILVEHDDGTLDERRAVLVEVYEDRAAYDAHRQNPRMPQVTAALEPLIVGRHRTIGRLGDS